MATQQIGWSVQAKLLNTILKQLQRLTSVSGSSSSTILTKLNTIESGAQVNTIDSVLTGEPVGSDRVLNVVSLTQAEYNAGTPVATTFYVIIG
jgi:hypothetical protein